MEPVKTLTAGELLAHKFPPEYYIASHGLLGKQAMLVIFGPPKVYKSFVLSSILANLVTGTNVLNTHRVCKGGAIEKMFTVSTPQRVLLLEQEIGYYDLQQRLKFLHASYPPEHQALLNDNLIIHSCDYDLNLGTSQGCQYIEDIVKRTRPTVIAFDPLFDFHRVNENASDQMGIVFGNLFRLKEMYKVGMIVNHHEGKMDTNKPRSGPDLMRGSSVIFQKGDSYIGIRVLNRNAGQLRLDFTLRRGKPLRPIRVGIAWETLRAEFLTFNVTPTKKDLLEEGDADDAMTAKVN